MEVFIRTITLGQLKSFGWIGAPCGEGRAQSILPERISKAWRAAAVTRMRRPLLRAKPPAQAVAFCALAAIMMLIPDITGAFHRTRRGTAAAWICRIGFMSRGRCRAVQFRIWQGLSRSRVAAKAHPVASILLSSATANLWNRQPSRALGQPHRDDSYSAIHFRMRSAISQAGLRGLAAQNLSHFDCRRRVVRAKSRIP